MDALNADTDFYYHPDVDSDVHPASRGDLKPATVKYAVSQAIVFLHALGGALAAADGGLSLLSPIRKEFHHDHL